MSSEHHRASGTWPVLRRYQGEALARIALPLGGIGTGTVSLGGRGQLKDWELMNRPSKGFQPERSFFALVARPEGGSWVARALEGALLPGECEGAFGSPVPNAGLPRFRQCVFETAYPLAVVRLFDPEVPVLVRLEAFNPFVPADAEASGLPIAVLRFRLQNRTSRPVDVTVCGNLQNFIGRDGSGGESRANRNTFRETVHGWKGLVLSSEGVSATDQRWGTLALVTDAARVSYRTAWRWTRWNRGLLDFWDDLTEDGLLDERERDPGDAAPIGSLAATLQVPPRAWRSVTFLLAWHFPNRYGWFSPSSAPAPSGPPRALTPFVRTLEVSRFLPADPTLSVWDYPGDPSALGFEPRTFTGDFCDLHPAIASQTGEDRCVVFRHRFMCLEPMRLEVLVGYDGPVRVWVDGRLAYYDPNGKNPAVPDSARVPFEASAGEHEVMITLGTRRGQSWGIFLRYERLDVPLSVREQRGPFALPVFPLPSSGSCSCDADPRGPGWVGNYYTTLFQDAWDVVEKSVPRLPELERRTVQFVRTFCASDLPDAVKEAALFNLSTLRSPTCFRIASGEFMGWEGCGDKDGCCFGSCTHVWNYETATALLFGSLARGMREVEFLYATRDDGQMSFRVTLPLSRGSDWDKAAADGQMGCILKVYREWQLSGDETWLARLWPRVRRALEFCWIPGGWDADGDGVMEGCQHNTMDVEYYGPNPQMQFWYLGALRAAEEMARYLGETAFAERCHTLFERGSAWTDEHLFNGEYYQQEIRPPASATALRPSLRLDMGAHDPLHPDYQLGTGCLVDQLVGQSMAHLCGLGHLASRRHIVRALRSIWRYNRRRSLRDHFNDMRTFALNDESALLMASYPRGERPRDPFPYFNEVMTGFEYTAAVHMIQEGLVREGLQVMASVRARYDGRRRNPFNEAECGHHYARAMASWSAVPALSGFHYSAVTGTLTFAARPGRHFWSTGEAWGRCVIRAPRRGQRTPWTVELCVLAGKVWVRTIRLHGPGQPSAQGPDHLLTEGQRVVFHALSGTV